jgi:hypothetical protein
MPSKNQPKQDVKSGEKGEEGKPSFDADREGESSAGATGKSKKSSVAADRDSSSR